MAEIQAMLLRTYKGVIEMKMIVRCNACGKQISEIEKDVITQEDVDMYQMNSFCEEHQQVQVEAVIDEQPPSE